MQKNAKKILIVGAGFAGREIAGEIRSKGTYGRVTGFLDDDPVKIGNSFDGFPVFGPVAEVARILAEHPADEALIAIPGATPRSSKPSTNTSPPRR